MFNLIRSRPLHREDTMMLEGCLLDGDFQRLMMCLTARLLAQRETTKRQRRNLLSYQLSKTWLMIINYCHQSYVREVLCKKPSLLADAHWRPRNRTHASLKKKKDIVLYPQQRRQGKYWNDSEDSKKESRLVYGRL